MDRFLYKVVRHKHGWAYRLWSTYSPVFTTQAEAIQAAKAAAHEMHEPGDYTSVRVEERPLVWRTELVIRSKEDAEVG